MNRSFDKNRFDIVLKATSLFLRWSVRALYVLLGLLGIGFVVFLFIPASSLNYDLANLESINVGYMNVLYEISDGGFTGVVNVKWLLVLLFFAGIANLSFFQYLQIKLRNIIYNVHEENPFSELNVKNLKYMAYSFFAASIILPLINSWLFMSVVNLFNIYQATVNFSINFQSLFMGILILILAYVFDYGTYLQEEHDMTV